jgi:hypothetical protein
MDLVRALINEPEDAPLWDKYSPHFALPKTDVKKGKWKGVKEQVVSAVNALRDAREVSTMTQQALREAKANYAQVLADAKTPGSAISEVHVKAFSKNLIDARERFQAALDVLRDKKDDVKDLELEHQHLVEDYNERVKNRADEIHRLKSGLRSLVGYVDGLVNKTQKANQYPMRTEEGAPVLDKDGKQVYGVGVRGFSDTAKDVAHKIVDNKGVEATPTNALNEGYIFQRGQFFRIEDSEGNVVPFKDAKAREVSEKAVFNAVSVSETEALKAGFSYLKSAKDILDENNERSVQRSRTSGVGRRIDLAATAEDTEIYKRIAKESDRERTYQEETGAALGAYGAKEYVTSSLDKRTLDIARNLARTNPDFNPAHAKGGWTQEMVDVWNSEKNKMATEYAQTVTYKKASNWLAEKGVPAAVAMLRKQSPESQAHYLAMFDELGGGGKEVWGDTLPSEAVRGKFRAAAAALRGLEEKRGALEKQTVMWGKGADAGKVVAVLGKDGVYRNSMGHEVLVTDSNTQVGVDKSPLNVWAGSGENTVLSNLNPRKFTFEGRPYVSVEQAYQSLKSGAFEQGVYNQYTGRAVQKIPGTLGTKTEGGYNLGLIKSLMKASFEQNESAKNALLATGERTITHTQDKGVWNKEFPRILTEIRKELSENSTPVATKSVASKATLSMNYADGTDGMRMRPEFAGKSTMDLIASGDRTATTRSSIGAFKGVKNGDVFTVTNSAGTTIKVRATSDPYPVSKVTPENWSKLEGWSPAVYNKYSDGFQMTYEKVLENVAGKAAASNLDTSNITRKMLRDNPDKVFIFGDNEARKGLGGQAQQMRGEPNAIGVATKRLPSRGEDAYWSDAEFERNKQILDADFKPAFEAKAAGKEVVVPKNGIGGGLSELSSRAPRTLEYINQQLSLLRENVAEKSTPVATKAGAKGISLHSGGAIGADYEWGVAVAKHGVVANHYMAEGFPTPHGNAFVTPEQMKVGLSQARKAARNLGRHMGSNEYVNSLLARNWAQVDNSDAVYAVSDLIAPYESGKATKSGKRYVNESGQTVVDGGTGYAVQMAINEGKPVYVFHQGTSQNYSHEVGWYKYDHLRKEFTKTSQPELVDSFAGIGTREINAVGAKAINDIVSAKFSTAEPSQKKDTVATLIGQDAGVKEAMHAVKELIQNPLGDANAVEKFGNALDYIKSQLKEISAAIKLDTGNQALLNRQAQFSRAYAAVEAAALRYKENQYVRAEGYPAMSLGARGEFTKRLQAVEHSLVDSGETPERLEQVRKLLDTAQKKSKRIAPTEELTSVATSPKPLDLMLGEANAAHVFAPPSEDVVQAMRDSVERRFGDRIRAVFEEGDTVTHASISARAEQWGADGAKQKVKGLWSPTENLIKVALATQHPMQTLDHESFHAFYSGMVEGGVLTEGARQILLKAANSEYVRKRLDALFPENKVQHADTGFGKEKHSSGVTHAESERMANMFALWRAGELTLAPAPRNIFAKIWGKLKRVIGILREEDKADVILKAFDAGHLKTNEAVHAIYNALSARDRMMTELNRWTRPLAVIAQRLFYTAEVNLDKAGKTYSPEYKKIRRLFKRAVGEGGENGYLDAKDQMLKKFSNLVAAPFRALEPEDMPRLAKALAGGYENPTTAIGKAREALIGENGLIRQIDKYMADAGVQYLTGVDEKTGQQIWKTVEPMPAGSMPKSFRVNDVMSKGDEFIADLWEHNHKEMTEMFNSTRAKFDLAVDQVKTPDQELVDFNRAVLQRVINTFGQLHIPELTTDIGMSPIMQALNSRSISWVNPKVYEKWGENDVMKTFTSYASQAVKLTESVRRFGNGNVELHAMLQKGEWDGLRKEIQHSFHVDIGETPPKKEAGKKKLSMFDAAKQSIYEEKSLNAGEKAHLEKIFKRIKDVAKKAGTDVAGMQGLLGYDINPTLRKFQNSMLVYQNMRSLATSLLSQFIDPLNLVVRGATMGEAWDAYKRGLREVVASIKGEEIRDLDLTIAEHVGTVDAHGFLGAYGQLYSSEYMGNWFRKANDFLFRYNGMEGFNRGMQVAATRSAINFIKRHTEKPGKNSSSYLAEIGLRAEKVKIDERGELDYNDPRIQRAIYQWVSGAVMRPNASQRPAYASDPHYMVFWHMKQFAYTFHDSIMKRAIHDYNKYGDTGPLGVMATCFAPVMIAADVAKSVLLTGDAPGWWNAGLPDIIEHGVNRAGLSGQYQPIVDIATTPGRSWLGLGGPMIEQLQQLGDQTMGQAAVSALPGQNVIKQVFGVGGGGVEMLNTSED